MGLGPHSTSLLERLGRPSEITLDFLLMDRQERGQLRRAAAIGYATRHKKPAKPLAPVEAVKIGKVKWWRWLGETGPLINGDLYSTKEIRAQGFKVPKWEVQKPKVTIEYDVHPEDCNCAECDELIIGRGNAD